MLDALAWEVQEELQCPPQILALLASVGQGDVGHDGVLDALAWQVPEELQCPP